ncbi:Regulatory protein RecX [hydrothermal vent metagenome]|uniref:Regulatory protein RecX n=1 Tax=hydrothermal vent metagenome TaxID=652676 RepID=A0A3B1BH57_9ZZZZ
MAKSIRESAMNYLARREHSRLELEQKLAAKDFDKNEISDALARLVADDLLSDVRFAESFVNARIQSGKGPVKIQIELKQRGVDETIISQYLNNRETDWYEQACRVRCKRFGPALPSEYQQRIRQARFLQQRGFTHEQINAAFKKERVTSDE